MSPSVFWSQNGLHVHPVPDILLSALPASMISQSTICLSMRMERRCVSMSQLELPLMQEHRRRMDRLHRREVTLEYPSSKWMKRVRNGRGPLRRLLTSLISICRVAVGLLKDHPCRFVDLQGFVSLFACIYMILQCTSLSSAASSCSQLSRNTHENKAYLHGKL